MFNPLLLLNACSVSPPFGILYHLSVDIIIISTFTDPFQLVFDDSTQVNVSVPSNHFYITLKKGFYCLYACKLLKGYCFLLLAWNAVPSTDKRAQ